MRRRGLAVVGVTAAFGLSGCGLGQGLYNVSLPGGANLGSHPYKVTVQFSDALDLVPQSAVKVNDVAVGKVTSIKLEPNGKIADVVVQVNGNVHLPANAVASIQQTSLLGEKYVALAPPSGPATGTLADGATIALPKTADGVEVEQVLGALSLLLNGGGVSQLHEISTELNEFAHGNETAIRDFLNSTTNVVTQLNAHKDSITAALDSLATLSATLQSNDTQIAQILTTITPGIAILASEHDQLISALDALDNLSNVTVATLDASKQDIVSDLQSLAPILTQLADAGTALPNSLQVLATYPFTDAALNAIQGDYINAFITTDYNTPGGSVVQQDSFPTLQPPVPGSANPQAIAPPAGMLTPTSSAGPGLPATVAITPPAAGGGGN